MKIGGNLPLSVPELSKPSGGEKNGRKTPKVTDENVQKTETFSRVLAVERTGFCIRMFPKSAFRMPNFDSKTVEDDLFAPVPVCPHVCFMLLGSLWMFIVFCSFLA